MGKRWLKRDIPTQVYEAEWVMLVNDADLHECLQILDFVGGRTLKFLVRDTPCAMGSSDSSNCFIASGS